MAQKDPWAEFQPAAADEYSGFEVLPPAMAPEAYTAEFQRRFDAGASKDDLIAFMRENNVDPAVEARYLDDVLKARQQGRRVMFTAGEPAKVDETILQSLARGAGDVVEGIGDTLGLIANPLNGLINLTGIPKAALGYDLPTDMGANLRDLSGAPDAITPGEKRVGAGVQGAASALGGAGLARTVAGGLTGGGRMIANSLLEAPVRDAVAGAAGGLGADYGEEIGGPVGGFVGALAGGAAGYGGFRTVEAAAEKLASRVPKEVAIAPDGRLTDDGRELAQRAGVSEEELVRTYARRRTPNLRPPTGRAAPTGEVPQPRQAGDLQQADSAIMEELRRRYENGQLSLDGPSAPPPPPQDLFTEARDNGIPLTRGQAEQSFPIQNDENTLRVSASREGNEARLFFQRQAEAIKGATQRLQDVFANQARGDSAAPNAVGTAAERGQIVKDALRELRDNGAEGVRELYRQAEALGGEQLGLSTDGIYAAAEDVLIDEAVPELVKRSIGQELARYGIVGTDAVTNETGLTKAKLTDGSTVSFRGPVQPLTVRNAENLRKAINRLYMSDPTKASQSIKPAIDDALEQALEQAAGGAGDVAGAYRAARDAFQTQKRTFAAKDIIQNLIDVKKGTATDLVLPEQGIAKVIGSGPDAVSNLKRTRAVLLNNATPQSRQAWAAIGQQALADIFDGATVRNSSMGGVDGAVETISGAKLRTMIFDRYGSDKLRIILGDEQFNQLMKLQRVIGAATIPISGTTNPSGTATKLMNFMRSGVMRFTGLGPMGDAAMALVTKAKDLAATRKTLEGITNYQGRASGEEMDRSARAFFREYVDAGKAGRLMPTTLSGSAAASGATPRGQE